jgi:hypothetical protein
MLPIVYAMRLSLLVGVAMLIGKESAYVLTGSVAILSDTIESVIHVVAVAFAACRPYLSIKPATQRFPCAYGRIWSGRRLMFRSIGGLMDYPDPRCPDACRKPSTRSAATCSSSVTG